MSFYTQLAFRIFGQVTEQIEVYFTDTKNTLKQASMKYSLQEYLSIAIMTCFLVFLMQLPFLSFAFGFVFQSFLFSFLSAITLSFAISVLLFVVFIYYPKIEADSKAKNIDNALPFAALYLSTVAGSHLPLDKIFQIFSKFSGYTAVSKEVNAINEDVKVFGFDIETSLERAVERTPSKNFKELLYGILSVVRSGGELPGFLKEKATNFMAEYRRKIVEFSRNLTVFIEIYLTSVVMGAIFFTILTAIISGISGTAGNIIVLQFLVIFVFLPLISIMFIVLVKSSSPGEE